MNIIIERVKNVLCTPAYALIMMLWVLMLLHNPDCVYREGTCDAIAQPLFELISISTPAATLFLYLFNGYNKTLNFFRRIYSNKYLTFFISFTGLISFITFNLFKITNSDIFGYPFIGSYALLMPFVLFSIITLPIFLGAVCCKLWDLINEDAKDKT